MDLHKETVFNSNMLKIAREYNNITQTGLSKAIGISQSKLSKYESGLMLPNKDEIKLIADSLGFPPEFFTQLGWIYPPIVPFHRKRVSISKRFLAKAEAVGNIQRIQIQRLLSQVDIQENVIHLDPEDYKDGVVSVAQAVRNYYRLPKGPIKNVTELFEDNGIIVSLINLFSDKIDGFTLLGNGKENPIVFVNNRFPGDKIRLTLAHELGHIVMHSIQHDDVEKEAWAFANEFLMPADEIKKDLHRIKNIKQLVPLKIKWKVSMMALIRRTHDLGLITERTLRYLYQQMAPYRKIEPIGIPVEKPSLIKEILSLYKNDLGYSDAELQDYLLSKKDLYKELYTENRPKLKLVRKNENNS